MNKAVLIQSEDWEGLFINGKLVKEGHTLNEGYSRVKFFLQLAKEYNFNLEDMQEGYVTDEYDQKMYDTGCFDKLLDDIAYTCD